MRTFTFNTLEVHIFSIKNDRKIYFFELNQNYCQNTNNDLALEINLYFTLFRLLLHVSYLLSFSV